MQNRMNDHLKFSRTDFSTPKPTILLVVGLLIMVSVWNTSISYSFTGERTWFEGNGTTTQEDLNPMLQIVKMTEQETRQQILDMLGELGLSENDMRGWRDFLSRSRGDELNRVYHRVRLIYLMHRRQNIQFA